MSESQPSKVGAIHAAMVRIMAKVGVVGKAGTAKEGYAYRKVDDVYAKIQTILSEEKVYTTSEIVSDRSEDRKSKSGGNLIYRILVIKYTFWSAEDGSSVSSTTVGEGMDSSDKASNKAMSAAHKYALCQAFCIPTVEPKDSEEDSHETDGNDHSEKRSSDQRSQPQKNPPPPPKIFNSKDYEQTIKLEAYLKKSNIPQELWLRISDDLNGKPESELPNLLKAINK